MARPAYDSLEGGEHNDLLNGGVGNDLSRGGGGNDTFLFGEIGGNDRIFEFLPRGSDKREPDRRSTPLPAGPTTHSASSGRARAPAVSAGQLTGLRSGGSNWVAGDVHGDSVADFAIQTNVLLASTDFIL